MKLARTKDYKGLQKGSLGMGRSSVVSLLLGVVLLVAAMAPCLALNDTNDTTVIFNNSSDTNVGFTVDTILWIIFIILFIAAIVLYKKIPGVAIIFAFYGVIFSFILLPVFGFWVWMIIAGFSIMVGIPAFLSAKG